MLAGSCSCPRAAIPSRARSTCSAPLLSIAALVTLVFGVIEAPEQGWTDPLILGCFGVAAVLAAAFVAWELHTPSRC